MVDSINIAGQPTASLRKQQRGLVTRQELLRSARAIFARDGFEHARIEDIAANAGRTRGAFYDNFKDKEDVFYAIFEENIDRDLAELAPRLASLPVMEEREAALADYLSGLTMDRERTLLNLEFKLYAIRHPLKRKRLADLHNMMCLRCSIPEINQLFTEPIKRGATARLADSLALGGVVDGLALNHLFNPEKLDEQELIRYVKLCLSETLLGLQDKTVPQKDDLIRSMQQPLPHPASRRDTLESSPQN
ncbi:TetR/AcrR family transcriptional regulator [Granulicella tundricola]|nr:TetR/AcrR family transcriptional regulator [Granulicella tundricola]